MLIPRAFRIASTDNVATLLDDGERGPLLVLGEAGGERFLVEAIRLGHKVALEDLSMDAPVIKFGIPIGKTTQAIPSGSWVHLHNCESFLDERSQSFDLHTGGTTDTIYE